jgi:hypothetical protein
MPDTQVFARSAVRTIGNAAETSGHIGHQIQVNFVFIFIAKKCVNFSDGNVTSPSNVHGQFWHETNGGKNAGGLAEEASIGRLMNWMEKEGKKFSKGKAEIGTVLLTERLTL